MSINLLIENLTNPALLFFLLGLLAVQLKSDLAIPENSSKFISLYLLFSIGFKGGVELSHSTFNMEMFWVIAFGLSLALIIPVYTFFILKIKFDTENAGAIAAAYGSISAVTFVTCVSYIEMHQETFSGYMIAIMALMEAPAIIVGVMLMSIFGKRRNSHATIGHVVRHSFTNGSVLLILGSLIIGYLASDQHARGIEPFTTDIFKGFLAVFLLDMGIVSGKKLSAFWKNGYFPFVFSIVIPLFNGILVSIISGALTQNIGDRLLLAVLAASASYIAVPAAMKLAAPKANPGLYVPMALAITFPFNITIGIPLYYYLASNF